MRKIIQLVKENKFYALMITISVALSITFVMGFTIIDTLLRGNVTPEIQRQQTVEYSKLIIQQKDQSKAPFQFTQKSAAEIFANNPAVNFYTFSTTGGRPKQFAHPKGSRITLYEMRSDEKHWNLYDFTFTEGGPFTREQVAAQAPVAVINESTAYRLFGKKQGVLGMTLRATETKKTYKVIGVVEDESLFFIKSVADVWFPIGSNDIGSVVVRRTDGFDTEDVNSYLTEGINRYNQTYYSGLESAISTKELNPDEHAEGHPMYYYMMTFFAAIAFLLPAINGMNISSSYISNRMSEIAIKKTYGASDFDIIRQLLWENFAITLVGAFIGLFLSFQILPFLLHYMSGQQHRGTTAEVTIPIEIMLNYRIYIALLIYTLLFNIISIYRPARRATRMNIAESIKGEY